MFISLNKTNRFIEAFAVKSHVYATSREKATCVTWAHYAAYMTVVHEHTTLAIQ